MRIHAQTHIFIYIYIYREREREVERERASEVGREIEERERERERGREIERERSSCGQCLSERAGYKRQPRSAQLSRAALQKERPEAPGTKPTPGHLKNEKKFKFKR